MVKSSRSGPKIIHDTSTSSASYKSGGSKAEWRNFMSPSINDMYRKSASRESGNQPEDDEEMDIRKILKDIEYLGSSNMSWKDRKELEKQNVVSLGGKPPKNPRIPLSIARATMKKQQQREQKLLEEGQILGRFGKQVNNKVEKRKTADRVLKASEGHFKNGVLNVKHLLGGPSSAKDNINMHRGGKGKKKGSRKKKGNGKKDGKKHW